MRISDWSSDVCSSDLGSGAFLVSNTIRTGTRCTTLTKFPVAFCDGRIAKACPAPRCTESTCPSNATSGKASILIDTGWPTRISVSCVSRSEEHTSELQSLMRTSYDVICLKKKRHKTAITTLHTYVII